MVRRFSAVGLAMVATADDFDPEHSGNHSGREIEPGGEAAS